MKKVLAVIFLLVATTLSLAAVTQIPKVIRLLLNSENDGYSIGYTIGFIVTFVIQGGIAFVLFKFGIKWLRGKTLESTATLDEEFKTGE
jgi:hypothetical protein